MEFKSKGDFLDYIKILSEKEILAAGERWEDVEEKEQEWATLHKRYHATLDFSFPTGTAFCLDIWAKIDDGDNLYDVYWDQSLNVYAGACPYGYMNFSKEYGIKKKRLSASELRAIDICNFVGHNCYNPFGLMDR